MTGMRFLRFMAELESAPDAHAAEALSFVGLHPCWNYWQGIVAACADAGTPIGWSLPERHGGWGRSSAPASWGPDWRGGHQHRPTPRRRSGEPIRWDVGAQRQSLHGPRRSDGLVIA